MNCNKNNQNNDGVHHDFYSIPYIQNVIQIFENKSYRAIYDQ